MIADAKKNSEEYHALERLFTSQQAKSGYLMRPLLRMIQKKDDSARLIIENNDFSEFVFEWRKYNIKGSFPLKYSLSFPVPYCLEVYFDRVYSNQSIQETVSDESLDKDLSSLFFSIFQKSYELIENQILFPSNKSELPFIDEKTSKIFYKKTCSNAKKLFDLDITDFMNLHYDAFKFLVNDCLVEKIKFTAGDSTLTIKPYIFSVIKEEDKRLKIIQQKKESIENAYAKYRALLGNPSGLTKSFF
ncbi:MAG: hypothetical protein WC393_03915 [Candidatus Nanoarchaeia archaeon]|jgi:hypothetical protein